MPIGVYRVGWERQWLSVGELQRTRTGELGRGGALRELSAHRIAASIFLLRQRSGTHDDTTPALRIANQLLLYSDWPISCTSYVWIPATYTSQVTCALKGDCEWLSRILCSNCQPAIGSFAGSWQGRAQPCSQWATERRFCGQKRAVDGRSGSHPHRPNDEMRGSTWRSPRLCPGCGVPF